MGYALYHHGYDTDHGRRVLHLIDLYVQETWRRQGIGEALVRRVAEAGRAHTAQVMFWSVYKPNTTATSFYERLGALLEHLTGWLYIEPGPDWHSALKTRPVSISVWRILVAMHLSATDRVVNGAAQ